jgi:branched-chain amino acid transport system permease protein
MGGYIAWFMSTYGIHPIYGLPVAIVLMFGFGWLMYVLIIKWVIGRDLFTSLLATFGMALVISQLLNLAFGPEVQVARSGFEIRSFFDNSVTVADIKLVSLLLAAVLATMVVLFMKHSRMGQAIRATSQDPRAARVMGIDTEGVYAFTYALNAAICGAAGVLISMIWVIQPFFGISYSIRAFVIVTAAGLGNLPGVILAGLGLGVIEQYGGFVLGAELQQFTVVAMLLVVLIWRQMLQKRHRQALQ